MKLTRKAKRNLAVVSAGASALVAKASYAIAVTDVQSVLDEIGTVPAVIAAIGAAGLLIYVGIKTYQWIKSGIRGAA